MNASQAGKKIANIASFPSEGKYRIDFEDGDVVTLNNVDPDTKSELVNAMWNGYEIEVSISILGSPTVPIELPEA